MIYLEVFLKKFIKNEGITTFGINTEVQQVGCELDSRINFINYSLIHEIYLF